MGLLDSVLGSVLHAQQGERPSGQGGLAEVLGGLLGQGGQQTASGGLGALLPVLIGLVANNGQTGGLGGLKEKFDQAGLGEVMDSWIGSGQNAPISGDQLGAVLGSDLMGELSKQLGASPGDAAGQLAQALPSLIDHLTPHGSAPEGGLGDAGDLFGMLGGMLQKG
jgi:uncharacterized protein YidB (DUF937 family)